MVFITCWAQTIGISIIVALLAVGAAIVQVRLLRAVGHRFQGLIRSLVGIVASTPTALVIAILPVWLIRRFGCNDDTTVPLPFGFIGVYAAALISYGFFIKKHLSELKAYGFFWGISKM